MNRMQAGAAAAPLKRPPSFFQRLIKNVRRDKYLLLLVALPVAYYIIFHFVPLYGLQIAFKRYSPGKGIWGSPWVGLKWFDQFFGSVFAWRLIRNVLLLNAYNLIFGFPLPILFAFLLNEVKNERFKKIVQTISYMPHFVSVVVIVGMVFTFLSVNDGIVNTFLNLLGIESINFMSEPRWFRTVYIASGVWQSFGWSSIIYLAALSGIDVAQYEAARIDGANRLGQAVHITLPGILPTIIILLILQVGRMMSVGYEKIILMYNTATYEVADVISTYVYRNGILGGDFSFGTAVDFFNNIVNFVLLLSINWVSKKVSNISLW